MGNTTIPPLIEDEEDQLAAMGDLSRDQQQARMSKNDNDDVVDDGQTQATAPSPTRRNNDETRFSKTQMEAMKKQLEELEKATATFSKSKSFGCLGAFMPGLKSVISMALGGITNPVKNSKGKAKVMVLQKVVTILRTLKKTLETAKKGSSCFDACSSWASCCTGSCATIIIPIILIITAPLIITLLWIIFLMFSVGILTSSIDKFIKVVDEKLVYFEKLLAAEQAKLLKKGQLKKIIAEGEAAQQKPENVV